MVKDNIWRLDLLLDIETLCIKLLIRDRADRVCTLGVPNSMLCVCGQRPIFSVKRSTPHVQMSTPNILDWVELDGLLTLTFDQV